MIREFFKTMQDYFTRLFATYKEDVRSNNTSSKTITIGGFYTIIHENQREAEN